MAFLIKFGGVSAANLSEESTQSATLRISGMQCAGCVQAVERQLLKQEGVADAVVNLVMQNARVEFLPSVVDPEHLANVLSQSGFESDVMSSSQTTGSDLPAAESSNPGQLFFAIALVFFSALGHLQDVLPIMLPIVGTMAFHGVLATMALAGPGRSMVVAGFKGLIHNQPTMDTLVSMGSVISYGVSIIALLYPNLGWDCFFDATVMIIGLILLGRTLEAQAKVKAKSSFQSLLSLQSREAHRYTQSSPAKGEHLETVSVETVMSGDQLQVLMGEHFPVDGVIISGETLVDESMLTGESLPVEKKPRDAVTAGTLNQQGPVRIEATRTGAETTLAKITGLVEEAQTRKAPIQHIADTVAGYFTYGVMAIALITFLFWWIWGTQQWPEVLDISSSMHSMEMPEMNSHANILVSVKFAIAVLVIACPCALGLATPTALLVGTSIGAERGLLLRGGDVLEQCSQLRTIVFDKTGTLTTGQLQVSNCFLSEQPHPVISSSTTLLQWIASVEQFSRHPLAMAILEHARTTELLPVDAVESVTGGGIAATYQNQSVKVGSLSWLAQHQISISPADQALAAQFMQAGKTVIYCAIDQQIAGGIALQDTLRSEAKQTLLALDKMGLSTHILTGDRWENTTVLLKSLALSPDQIDANLSPGQKADRLKELQQQGPIAMVGDGINDAPALAQADVGIALSSGTDVAMETAQIILTRSQVKGDQIALDDIVQALSLSQATFRKIKQNLFWAFIYNFLSIPIAAGFLFPITHLTLSPSAAAALMALSSVSVIGNSLLLQTQWRSMSSQQPQ